VPEQCADAITATLTTRVCVFGEVYAQVTRDDLVPKDENTGTKKLFLLKL
jgi:hypothetical protein